MKIDYMKKLDYIRKIQETVQKDYYCFSVEDFIPIQSTNHPFLEANSNKELFIESLGYNEYTGCVNYHIFARINHASVQKIYNQFRNDNILTDFPLGESEGYYHILPSYGKSLELQSLNLADLKAVDARLQDYIQYKKSKRENIQVIADCAEKNIHLRNTMQIKLNRFDNPFIGLIENENFTLRGFEKELSKNGVANYYILASPSWLNSAKSTRYPIEMINDKHLNAIKEHIRRLDLDKNIDKEKKNILSPKRPMIPKLKLR